LEIQIDPEAVYTGTVEGDRVQCFQDTVIIRNAFDYWARNSCNQFLGGIRVPSLLVTATDDTFLSESCYPFEQARSHKYFHLEATRFGGHVGYNSEFSNGSGFWLEKRIASFLENPEPVG
jgi:predicted alpha/beta-fold hydrolase